MALRINGYGENCNINLSIMFPLFHKKVKNEFQFLGVGGGLKKGADLMRPRVEIGTIL